MTKISKKSLAQKASSVKLSPAQKAADTRKAKQAEKDQRIKDLANENLKLSDEIHKLTNCKTEIKALAINFSREIEELNREKAAFIASWTLRFNVIETERLKYKSFIENEIKILS